MSENINHKTEVLDIIGIICAMGITQGEELWSLHFNFEAWRCGDAPLHNGKIIVVKRVDKMELDAISERFQPYDVICIRARQLKESELELIEIVGKHESDEELNRLAQELQEPKSFEDSIFGTFSLDRKYSWYQTHIFWNSVAARLNLSVDDCEDVSAVLDVAHILWESQKCLEPSNL